MKKASVPVPPSAGAPVSFKGYRFPLDIIGYVVWLYFRFPLSLRMVEEMLAARGIELTYETVRCWATKFGPADREADPSVGARCGDKSHLDEVVVTINGTKHWLCGGPSVSTTPSSTCWCSAGATRRPTANWA